ncbi:hypothetical protein DM860_008601 [Cuscuta australis]|uniref:Uncharacterized protein n=1 Tax=Cuscuta australis TaxID=267555 RepID=A0A328DAE4_9ASTE|nr:hypothetical protein DM860_008601 [Cuscuta australis]
MVMGKNGVLFVVVTLTLLLLGCSSSSSAAPPAAKIVGAVVTNVVSLFKLLWSLKSTTSPTPKPVVSSRSTMKFESGYTVETVFDGSKVGIEPFSVEVSPAGEVLILDYQNSNIYKTSSPLSRSIALLATAVFLGYMIALVQRRMAALFSSHSDLETPTRGILPPPSQYQLNAKPIRPPLIPPPAEDDDEYEKTGENLFVSIGRLFAAASASVFEIFGGMFSRSRPNKKSRPQQHHHHHHRLQHYPSYPNYDNPPVARPLQESYVIPREEEPPHLEPVDPTPRNSYSHTPLKDVERARHFKQSRPNATYSGWTGDPRQQQLQQQQQQQHQQQHYYQQQQQQQQQQFQQLHRHQKHRAPSPQTYIEKSCETKEIVFGAVQEQDGRREAMVIKAVDYSDPAAFNRYNVRSRYNYNATYSHGYN